MRLIYIQVQLESFTLRSRCFVHELVIASDWDCMIYHCIYSQASLLATACMQQQLAEHVFMQFFSARWEGLVQILTNPSHSTISYCCRPGESQPNGEVNSVARTQRLVQIRLCDESSWKNLLDHRFVMSVSRKLSYQSGAVQVKLLAFALRVHSLESTFDTVVHRW